MQSKYKRRLKKNPEKRVSDLLIFKEEEMDVTRLNKKTIRE
jgi:hypothetical protein